METWYYANDNGYITPVSVTAHTDRSVTIANSGTYPILTEARIYTDSLQRAVDFSRNKLTQKVAELSGQLEAERQKLKNFEAQHGL